MRELTLSIIPVQFYRQDGSLIIGLSGFDIVKQVGQTAPVVLDSHTAESTAFECILRWVERYRKLGFEVTVIE